ncbi:hypothetical protein C5708_15390 [Caulobacter sp. CCUG 60055]|nr:hypothetical protein [Caulobacter sp. CCUG 60055]
MVKSASLARLRAVAAVALLASASAAWAQKPPPAVQPEAPGENGGILGVEPKGPPRPTPRLPDGKPDLTGFWKPLRDPSKPGGNIGKDLPGFKLPLTPAGEAALQHNLTQTRDPEALCILGGIPRHDASGLPFEILHTPQRLGVLYLYTTYRLIPIDGRKHEEDPEPGFFGNPVGWWEGDVLVVDSIGFKDKQIWIDENANPQSDAMHVVERWSRPDADHLHLDLTVDDSKFYTRPFTFARTWVLGKPREGLREFACNENNVDKEHLGFGPGPIRPDGNRGYLTDKLPDNPPPPEFYETKK